MQTRKVHQCNLHSAQWRKAERFSKMLSLQEKLHFKEYSTADHIMREHGPPLNKGERKGKQCCATANLPICQLVVQFCEQLQPWLECFLCG